MHAQEKEKKAITTSVNASWIHIFRLLGVYLKNNHHALLSLWLQLPRIQIPISLRSNSSIRLHYWHQLVSAYVLFTGIQSSKQSNLSGTKRRCWDPSMYQITDPGKNSKYRSQQEKLTMIKVKYKSRDQPGLLLTATSSSRFPCIPCMFVGTVPF